MSPLGRASGQNVGGKESRHANSYSFAMLFFAETDNLRIYGQVKINKVKICLVRMGLICLCSGEETRLCVISQSEALSVTPFASL